MNKREKKLLVVTGLVVVVGLLTMLGGDEEQIPVAVATTAPPPVLSKNLEIPLGPMAPLAYQFEPEALTNLLAIRSQPTIDIPTTDPFVIETLAAGSGKRRTRGERDSFRLNGVFISKHSRGAIIDGESYFEGDWLDPSAHPNSKLISVQPDQVEIQVRDRRVVIPLQVVPEMGRSKVEE